MKAFLRPLPWETTCLEDHIFLAECPIFQCHWICYQRPPFLRPYFLWPVKTGSTVLAKTSRAVQDCKTLGSKQATNNPSSTYIARWSSLIGSQALALILISVADIFIAHKQWPTTRIIYLRQTPVYPSTGRISPCKTWNHCWAYIPLLCKRSKLSYQDQ